MKKHIGIGMVFGAFMLAVIGAVIDSRSFNQNQFVTDNGSAAIKVSAKVTNLFRIFGNKGGAGTFTNIEPVWIDVTDGWQSLEGTGHWTNCIILKMAVKPGGVEGDGFYWGDPLKLSFQSWRCGSTPEGVLDPRMTHVFGASDNYTHRLRTNLLEYLEQDDDGNLLMAGAVYTFNRSTLDMVLGSNSLSTSLKGSAIYLRTNAAVDGTLSVSNAINSYGNANLPGSAKFYDTNGLISELRSSHQSTSNNTLVLPTNSLTGLMVAVQKAVSTNQIITVALTPGQYVTYNGSSYVPSNLPPTSASGSAGPMTLTNFVLNTVYSNANANPILVRASAFLITAAVNGGPSLDLMYSQTGGTGYTLLSRVAIATTIAGAFTLPITNDITGVITNLGSYYFTNTSAGAGDSSGIVAGSGQITVFGGVGAAGAAGATGATGATGAAGAGAPDFTTTLQNFFDFDDLFYAGFSAGTTAPAGKFGLFTKVSSGTVNPLPGETNAPGIIRLATSTSGGTYGGLGNFTSGAANNPFYFRGAWTNEWRFRLGQTNVIGSAGNSLFEIGYGDAAGASPQNGVYLQYSSNSLTFVYGSANSFGTRTTNTTPTLAPVPGTWYKFRTVYTATAAATNCVCTIDGAQSATITATLPLTSGLHAFILNSNSTTNCNADLDYVGVGYSLEATR